MRNQIVAFLISVCGAGGIVVHLVLSQGYREEYIALIRSAGWQLIFPDEVLMKIGIALGFMTGLGIYGLIRRESFKGWIKPPGYFDIIFYAVLSIHLLLAITADEELGGEDGFFEWLTFWNAFAAAIVCVWLLVKYRIALFMFPAAFLLFIAMEEISWGQRVFEWETPDVLVSINQQEETNIHNIFDPWVSYLLSVFFMIVAFILVEIDVIVRILGDKHESWTTSTRRAVGITLLPVAFCGFAMAALRYPEYAETAFSIVCILIVLRIVSFRANLKIPTQRYSKT